jgi:translation initiation factor 3 subunit K
MLEGINRYNPENLNTLEQYLEMQVLENGYDLEANLTILKLYQFNPDYYRSNVACRILMKALTNLPYPDFVLCKCLLTADQMEDQHIKTILYLGDLMEMCKFPDVWKVLRETPGIYDRINGFEESVRRYICHIIGITCQKISRDSLRAMMGGVPDPALTAIMSKNGWREEKPNDPHSYIVIGNQEDKIKTKNITEKIDFESVSTIMATCK